MARRVDFPMPDPANTPVLWPAHRGVKRSITRTPVLVGWRTRLRRIAAGGARSVDVAWGPCCRAPAPSMGRQSASITRPFQERCGLMLIKPRQKAVAPRPTLLVTPNGLTVTPASSTRMTSPSWEPSLVVRSTHSPSLTMCESPRTRQ